MKKFKNKIKIHRLKNAQINKTKNKNRYEILEYLINKTTTKIPTRSKKKKN